MQTKRFIRWAVAAVFAASAIALAAACSGSDQDKAGGGEAEPRVLILANPNDGGPPAQILIDSSAVKAHRSAAGGKGGEQDQAIGRSRGGRTTKSTR